jgi:LPXTG-site transpeptidase (sortase) family protein
MKYILRIFITIILVVMPNLFGFVGYTFGLSLIEQESKNTPIKKSNVGSVEVKNNIQKSDFVLEVPTIGLRKEIGLNTDIYDQNSYEGVLGSKIAHAKFSLLPSDFELINSGVIYLFAHREGESNFFANLGNLTSGDELIIHENGKIFRFKVISSKIISSNQTADLFNTANQKILRLQTCENGEKSRLIVDSLFVGME